MSTQKLVYECSLLLLSHFSRVWLCATPEMAAHQAPPSLGFSRQEHWSGLPFPSPMHESEKWKWSCSVVSNSQRPHGLQPTRLLRPWDFPGKSTGVGCHCLLQWMFTAAKTWEPAKHWQISGYKRCGTYVQWTTSYKNKEIMSSAATGWRRQWHPTPVLFPGKSHGWRCLVGCSPWGLEESDTTERLHFRFSLSCTREGNGNPLQCSFLENPRDGRAWWAAIYGVAQSQTWLKRLSSSSSSNKDGPSDYHTKWSKSERERQTSFDITYMWSLKYDTN